MKKLSVIIIIGLFLLSACSKSAPSTSTSLTNGYQVSFHAYLQELTTVSPGSLLGLIQINPVGDVMLKNTDSVPRKFKVEITHYYEDKSYTKDFVLQLEPGQIKTATMDYNKDVHASLELAKIVSAGDWGIDYRVIPQ